MRWFGGAVFLLAVLFLGGCLERDNPCDPINVIPNVANPCFPIVTNPEDSLSKIIEAELVALEAERQAIFQLVVQFRQSVNNSWLERTSVIIANRDTVSKNASRLSQNAALDTVNVLSCYSLKSLLTFANSVNRINAGLNTDSLEQRIAALRNRTDSLVAVTHEWKDSSLIISPADRDSLLARWDALAADLNGGVNQLDSLNTSYDLETEGVDSLNTDWETENDSIRAFNDAVSQSDNFCNRPLTDPVAIRQSVPNLTPGDTLYLGGGEIDLTNFEVELEVSGTMDSMIVIYGNPDTLTVLTSTRRSPLTISNLNHIELVNIGFNNSPQSGVTLLNQSGSITFRNCQFVGNQGHGVDVIDTDIRLIHCRVTGNGQSGIRVNSAAAAVEQVYLENVLVAGNGEYGILGLTIRGEIIQATISDNGRDGIFLEVPQTDIAVRRSLITFNGGYGLHREQIANAQGVLTLDSCNLYNNTSGNLLSDPPYDSLPYLEVDPLYLDRAGEDYRLDSTSTVGSLGFQY